MDNKSPDNSYTLLRQNLKAGKTDRIYVFHGEESYLLEHSLSELINRLVPQGMEEFNLRFFDSKVSIAQLIQSVDSLPVLSESTLTIVRDLDVFSLSEKDSAELETMIDEFPDDATIIFVFDTIDYKPDGRRKLSRKLREKATVVDFSRRSRNDLVRWLKSRFAALEKNVSDQDAEYLIFIAGGLMTSLVGETEKLAAYQPGATITRADIDMVTVPVAEAIVFSLGDALASGNFDSALKILGDLLDTKEKPELLISLIGRQMRQLYSAKLFSRQNDPAQRLMAQWNMKSRYPAEKLIKNAGRLDLKWCRRAMLLCGQADMALKSFSTDKRLTMELLILEMALRDD